MSNRTSCPTESVTAIAIAVSTSAVLFGCAEPNTVDPGAKDNSLHYAISKVRKDNLQTSDGPVVISKCDFAKRSSILAVRVTSDPVLGDSCPDGSPGAYRPHWVVPVSVERVVAGKPVQASEIIALTGTADGPFVKGDEAIVSVALDQGKVLAGARIFVSESTDFVDTRTKLDHTAVDLPSARQELDAVLTRVQDQPASECTSDELARVVATPDMIAHYRTHSEDPCGGSVSADDGLPENTNAAEDDR